MAKTVEPDITFEEAEPEITFEEAPTGPAPKMEMPGEAVSLTASKPRAFSPLEELVVGKRPPSLEESSGYRMGMASFTPVDESARKKDTRPLISSEGENRSLLGRAGLILAGEIGGARFDNPHAGDVMTSRFLDRSPFGMVYKTLTGHPILTDEESQEHHYADLIGSIGGDLTSLSLIGKSMAAAGTPALVEGLASKIANPAIRAITAHMANTSLLFSASGMAQNLANQRALNEEISPGFTAETGLKDGMMGAALGLAGTIPNPLLRIIAEVGVGGVGAKLQGATPEQMYESMAVFGLFGFLGRKNITPLERAAAKNLLEQKLTKLSKVELPPDPSGAVNVEESLMGRIMANEMNKELDKLKLGQTKDTPVGEQDLVAVGEKLNSSLIAPNRVIELQKGATDPLFTYDQEAQARGLTNDKATARASFVRAEREAAQLPVRDQIIQLIGSPKDVITADEPPSSGGSAAEMGMRQAIERGRTVATEGVKQAQSETMAILKGKAEDLQNVRNLISEYAKNSLTGSQQRSADVKSLLNKVNQAKTNQDISQVFDAIDRIANGNRQREAATEVFKIARRVEDSPSLHVDFKDYATDLLRPFVGKGLNDQAALHKNPREIWRLAKQKINQLPVKDLQVLKDQMELLESAARDAAKNQKSQKAAYQDAVLDAMKQTAVSMDKLPVEGVPWFTKKVNGMWNRAIMGGMAVKPIDVLADIADGGHGTYDGPLYRQFKGATDMRFRQYLNGKRPDVDVSARLIQEGGFYRGGFLKPFGVEKTIDGMKHSERILIHAIRAQEGGPQKLLDHGYTNQQIESVKLIPTEMKWYQHTQKTFDAMGPLLEQFARRVGNQRFVKVKDYFPFMSEPKVGDVLPVIERFDRLLTSDAPSRTTKTAEQGMLQQREGGKQLLNTNAFDVFHRAVDNAHYLVNMGEHIQTNYQIANTPAFKAMYGDIGQKMWVDYFDTLARKGGAAGQQAFAAADMLRQYAGAGTLAFRPITMLMQYTSLPDSAALIGGSNMAKGIYRLMPTEGNKPYQMLYMKSPELLDRAGREVGYTEGGKFIQAGFSGIKKTDSHVAFATYAGAYEKFMADKKRPIDFYHLDPQADAYASHILRRAQNSASFKDIPQALSRGAFTKSIWGEGAIARSLDKAIFQFQSFSMNKYSLYRHDLLQAGITEQDPAKAIQMGLWLGMAHLLAGGARYQYANLINAMTGYVPTREDSFSDRVINDFLTTPPIAGALMDAWKYHSSPVPILGLVQDLTASEQKAAKAALRFLPGGGQFGEIAFKLGQEPRGSSTFPGLELPSLPSLPKLPSGLK